MSPIEDSKAFPIPLHPEHPKSPQSICQVQGAQGHWESQSLILHLLTQRIEAEPLPKSNSQVTKVSVCFNNALQFGTQI